MPPLKPLRLYWDSNAFLAYFNKEPTRLPDLLSILDEVRMSQGQYKIVTSILTKTEVAYIAAERTAPDAYPNVEAILDEFWANTLLIDLIEVHDVISTQARSFIRTAFVNGWHGIRANDAIHLGTALWVTQFVEVVAFQTYNLRDFEKFQPFVPFPIQEPRPFQPRLL